MFDNRPQYLQTSSKALAKAGMQGLGGRVPPHISIRGQKFRLVDAVNNEEVVNTPHLDVVVLNVNPVKSKMYFPDAYDPDNPSPPVCLSDNGVAPSVESSEPQSQTCGLCQWNRWGSKISQLGSKIKACQDYKKIAVLVPSRKDIAFLLSIPPNSFKHWTKYCGFIGANGADLWQVITRITFSDNELGTLLFNIKQTDGGQVSWVPQSFEPWYAKNAADNKWDDLIGLNDKPIDGAIPIAAVSGPAEPDKPLEPTRPGASQSLVQATNVVAGPGVASPPPARRGRPPKATPPAQVQPPVNGEDAGPELPDFLRRTSPGMVDAPAPDADLGQALDDTFNM